MIIIRIHGGLGNQMFQYALGLALSEAHGTPLKIDSSYLVSVNQSGRDFRLHGFSITPVEATAAEICSYTGTVQRIFDHVRPASAKKRIVEKTPAFNPKILTLKKGYFDGHWQSEQYFRGREATVRKNFALKNPFGPAAQKIAHHVRSAQNAISVHIRRGDYVTIEKVARVHGVLPLAYYETAMEKIVEHAPNAHFFISSDDIAWAKEHFPKKYPATFVSSPEIPDYEELILMSLCAHHIIANSTFSWWGAWLNQKPEKIVIAPKNWFSDHNRVIPDLIPPSWIQM